MLQWFQIQQSLIEPWHLTLNPSCCCERHDSGCNQTFKVLIVSFKKKDFPTSDEDKKKLREAVKRLKESKDEKNEKKFIDTVLYMIINDDATVDNTKRMLEGQLYCEG